MNTREKTLNLVQLYKEHQRQFESIYQALCRATPANNDYGMEMRGGTEIAKEFTLLSHPCRMVFDIGLDSEYFPGRARFLRVQGPERTSAFLDIHFDRLGNVTDDPRHPSTLHGVANPAQAAETADWLALRIIDAFFATRDAAR